MHTQTNTNTYVLHFVKMLCSCSCAQILVLPSQAPIPCLVFEHWVRAESHSGIVVHARCCPRFHARCTRFIIQSIAGFVLQSGELAEESLNNSTGDQHSKGGLRECQEGRQLQETRIRPIGAREPPRAAIIPLPVPPPLPIRREYPCISTALKSSWSQYPCWPSSSAPHCRPKMSQTTGETVSQ